MAPSAKPTPVQKYNYERSCYRWLVTRHPAQFERMEFTAKILESASKARKAFYESDWPQSKILIRATDGKYERTPFFDNIIKRGLRESTRFDASVLKEDEVEALGMYRDQTLGFKLQIRQFRAHDSSVTWADKVRASQVGEWNTVSRQEWAIRSDKSEPADLVVPKLDPARASSPVTNDSDSTTSTWGWPCKWNVHTSDGLATSDVVARESLCKSKVASVSGSTDMRGFWTKSPHPDWVNLNMGGVSPVDEPASSKRWADGNSHYVEPIVPKIITSGCSMNGSIGGSALAGPSGAGMEPCNYYGASSLASRPLLQNHSSMETGNAPPVSGPMCNGSLLAQGFRRLAQQRVQLGETKDPPTSVPPQPALAIPTTTLPSISPPTSPCPSVGQGDDSPLREHVGFSKRRRDSTTSETPRFSGKPMQLVPEDLLLAKRSKVVIEGDVKGNHGPHSSSSAKMEERRQVSPASQSASARSLQLSRELTESNKQLQAARRKYEAAKNEWAEANAAHQAKRDEIAAAAELPPAGEVAELDRELPSKGVATMKQSMMEDAVNSRVSALAGGVGRSSMAERDDGGALEVKVDLLRGIGGKSLSAPRIHPAGNRLPHNPTAIPQQGRVSPLMPLPRLPSCPSIKVDTSKLSGSSAAHIRPAAGSAVRWEEGRQSVCSVSPAIVDSNNQVPTYSATVCPTSSTPLKRSGGGGMGCDRLTNVIGKGTCASGLGRLIGLMSEGTERADAIQC
ncbi:unnamed protein product [Choristocarpus tenellus]